MDNDNINKVENPDTGFGETVIASDSAPEAKTEISASRRWCRILGVIGMLLALVAWVALFISETASLVCAIGAAVCSLAGCFGHKRVYWCVTAVIASVVLLLVYALFYWGVDYALSLL